MQKLIVASSLLTTLSVGLALAKDPGPPNPNVEAPKPVIKPKGNDGEIVPARASKQPVGDAAPKQLADQLVEAYKKADAKAFAAMFTSDGEYIDDKGVVFHGRKAIEDEFTTFFKHSPGTTIELDLNATRSIAKGVIASDGVTRFKQSATSAPIPGRCHLVLVQESDGWRIASLHEEDAEAKPATNRDHLSKLEWMLGEWIGEGPRSHVHFSCRWDAGGNYLLRDFSIQIGGEKAVEGSQRIGFDPVTGHLKTWIFDAAGGYSDGFFNPEGNAWVLRTSGVTSDGQIASMTAVFTPVDKNRMTTETVERMIGGMQVSDTEKLTIVRKPPESQERAAQAKAEKNK